MFFSAHMIDNRVEIKKNHMPLYIPIFILISPYKIYHILGLLYVAKPFLV
jgi:hypothetical protein